MSEKESWGRGGKGRARLHAESLRFGVVEGLRVRPKAELGAGQLVLVANSLLLILQIQNVSFL